VKDVQCPSPKCKHPIQFVFCLGRHSHPEAVTICSQSKIEMRVGRYKPTMSQSLVVIYSIRLIQRTEIPRYTASMIRPLQLRCLTVLVILVS